jgi:hypothetical protein
MLCDRDACRADAIAQLFHRQLLWVSHRASSIGPSKTAWDVSDNAASFVSQAGRVKEQEYTHIRAVLR